jgi:16S rRNA (cytosine967-C5)-methyltransferase
MPPSSRRDEEPRRSHGSHGSYGGDRDRRSSSRRGGATLPVTARNIAAEVVARVERDGAFAAAVLDHELKRAVQLNGRDRALATELVYGTLRLRTLLEKAVESVTPRGIQALDARTRALLLVAAYQLCYTRVPAFAAVSEAVEAIRSIKGRTIGGFANGALRQLALVTEKSPLPPLPAAFRDATAPWLRRALERSIGEDATEALLTAGPYPPPLNLRVRPKNGTAASTLRDEWVQKLVAALPNAKIEAAPFAPGAIRVRGAGDPHALPGYEEGAWTIQEEGSQLVAHLLGARPGDRVLDACAGRGNKSTLLAEQLAPHDGEKAGTLDVADVKPEKLGRLAHEFERLGLQPPRTFGVDWSKGRGDVEERAYDRVLVDAPCSGTGTIRRRPEIQTRRQAADLPVIADVQTKMLAHAVDVVKPGGRVLYAVCSVLRDEAEGVVARVRDQRGDVEPEPFDTPIAETLFGKDATQGRILTHLHGTDAYFVASLRRVR